MLHFGEEVRIGNLKVVLLAVGSQGVLKKDAPYGGTANRSAEDFRVFVKIVVGVTQRPRVDSGKRRALLAVDGDGC